jgi:hypothetical protein
MEFPAQAAGQSTPQPAATNPSANAPGTQSTLQQSAPSSSTPSSSTSGAAKPASTAPKSASHARKRVSSADCNAAASGAAVSPSTSHATSQGTSQGRSQATSKDASGPSGPSPGASANTAQTAPTNCPPKKIVVRQGGTSEPSIQLEPSAVGNEASQQKESTNQILGTAEQNLKRLEGRQLSADQQNMVSQARQFVDQARSAINAGDLDRAHTLAWKAQLLTEDLVKPEK